MHAIQIFSFKIVIFALASNLSIKTSDLGGENPGQARWFINLIYIVNRLTPSVWSFEQNKQRNFVGAKEISKSLISKKNGFNWRKITAGGWKQRIQ